MLAYHRAYESTNQFANVVGSTTTTTTTTAMDAGYDMWMQWARRAQHDAQRRRQLRRTRQQQEQQQLFLAAGTANLMPTKPHPPGRRLGNSLSNTDDLISGNVVDPRVERHMSLPCSKKRTLPTQLPPLPMQQQQQSPGGGKQQQQQQRQQQQRQYQFRSASLSSPASLPVEQKRRQPQPQQFQKQYYRRYVFDDSNRNQNAQCYDDDDDHDSTRGGAEVVVDYDDTDGDDDIAPQLGHDYDIRLDYGNNSSSNDNDNDNDNDVSDNDVNDNDADTARLNHSIRSLQLDDPAYSSSSVATLPISGENDADDKGNSRNHDVNALLFEQQEKIWRQIKLEQKLTTMQQQQQHQQQQLNRPKKKRVRTSDRIARDISASGRASPTKKPSLLDEPERYPASADRPERRDNDQDQHHLRLQGRRVKVVPQSSVEEALMKGEAILVTCVVCDKRLLVTSEMTMIYCPECGTLSSKSSLRK